jgi:hypothetical protein
MILGARGGVRKSRAGAQRRIRLARHQNRRRARKT